MITFKKYISSSLNKCLEGRRKKEERRNEKTGCKDVKKRSRKNKIEKEKKHQRDRGRKKKFMRKEETNVSMGVFAWVSLNKEI